MAFGTGGWCCRRGENIACEHNEPKKSVTGTFRRMASFYNDFELNLRPSRAWQRRTTTVRHTFSIRWEESPRSERQVARRGFGSAHACAENHRSTKCSHVHHGHRFTSPPASRIQPILKQRLPEKLSFRIQAMGRRRCLVQQCSFLPHASASDSANMTTPTVFPED